MHKPVSSLVPGLQTQHSSEHALLGVVNEEDVAAKSGGVLQRRGYASTLSPSSPSHYLPVPIFDAFPTHTTDAVYRSRKARPAVRRTCNCVRGATGMWCCRPDRTDRVEEKLRFLVGGVQKRWANNAPSVDQKLTSPPDTFFAGSE